MSKPSVDELNPLIETPTSDFWTWQIIAGTVAGFVVLTIIVIVLIVVIRKRNSSKKSVVESESLPYEDDSNSKQLYNQYALAPRNNKNTPKNPQYVPAPANLKNNPKSSTPTPLETNNVSSRSHYAPAPANRTTVSTNTSNNREKALMRPLPPTTIQSNADSSQNITNSSNGTLYTPIKPPSQPLGFSQGYRSPSPYGQLILSPPPVKYSKLQ